MRVYIILFVFVSLLINTDPTLTQPAVNLLWEKNANVKTMEFSPDGQFLVTGGATNMCYPYTCGQIKIWNVPDSELVRSITSYYIGLTNDIAFFDNGQTFLSAHGSIYCYPNGGCVLDKPGQFKWSFLNGDTLDSEGDLNGIIESIDISPDQTLIAAAISSNNIGEIRIYDMNYNLLRILDGHDESTTSLEFTPDNQFLVSGGHDGNVKIWSVTTGELIRTMFHGTYLNGGWDIAIDISPNGQYIASAGQGYEPTIKLWTFDGQLLHTILIDSLDGYNSISFSPNGLYLASGAILYGLNGVGWYGLLSFYNVPDGSLAEQYVDYTGSPTSGGIRSLAMSKSGDHYFAYSISNKLRVATVNIDLVTLTSVTSGEHSPASFELYDNYPNPFNPTTTIEYNLPVDNFVKITVYDVSGKEIAYPVNEFQRSGKHSVIFNGNRLASGVYFYKLTSANFQAIKKMILLK